MNSIRTRSFQGVSQQARLQESAHTVLLSVAVFAGLSERRDRFGLSLVHLVGLVFRQVSRPPTGLAIFFRGKRAEKEELD